MAKTNQLKAPLAFALTVGLVTPSIAKAGSRDPSAEQHIQHLLTAFPTQAVVVVGEAMPTTTLQARMAALHVPGVSIAFIHDGKVAWTKALGVAEVGGAPLSPQTRFQAGSISKPLTALAVLHLVQTRRLDLDADVNGYLKSWKVPDNSFTQTQKVTLRRLLSHTAGMTVHGFGGYAPGGPIPSLVQVLTGEKPANSPAVTVDVTPGTVWRYSGGGYEVVQQLLEDVTGEPFSQLMQETVLSPIGLAHSTYQQPLPHGMTTNAAAPNDARGAPIAGGARTYPEDAAAGLWTTPSDLALYAITVQNALGGKTNPILSAALAREMVKDGGKGGWGLGLQVGGEPSHRYFTHSGINAGFQSELVAFDHGDGLVIMTNGDNGSQLATEIQRAVAGEYDWPEFQPVKHTLVPVDEKVLDGYVGRYRFNAQATDTITRRGDRLFMQITGQPEYELFPEGAGNFFVKFTEAKFSFTMGPDGRASTLGLKTGAEAITMPRMPGDAAS